MVKRYSGCKGGGEGGASESPSVVSHTDALALKQQNTMFKRHHRHRRMRPQHGLRVLPEGDHHRISIHFRGPFLQFVQQRLVAAMHSIEKADRRNPVAAAWGVSDRGLKIFVAFHLLLRLPGTPPRTLSGRGLTLSMFLLQLSQDLLRQEFLRRVEMTQEEHSVQMIEFVLKNA